MADRIAQSSLTSGDSARAQLIAKIKADAAAMNGYVQPADRAVTSPSSGLSEYHGGGPDTIAADLAMVEAARHAAVARNRENRARLASAFAVYHSTGQGTLAYRRLFSFGLTYVEEPRMHYGTKVDIEALGDLLDNLPGNAPPLPHATGYVTDWEVDTRGFYTGAYLAVRVSYPIEDLIPVTLQVPVEHHFTFAGIAMKDVPTDAQD